jgi:Cu+-exporting ATPase
MAGFRALSKQSGHPMSRAVATALGEGALSELFDFEEVAGRGTQARIGTSIYRIGKSGFACEGEVLHKGLILGIDGRAVGILHSDVRYRPGLKSMAEHLRELNLQVELLSGDRDSERARLQEILGPETAFFFDRSPVDKLEHVRLKEQQGTRVLMVGDGLNDAGALKASSVGLGVVEEANTFTPACDGIVQGEKLDRLGDFIAFSKDSVRVVWWSFGLSIAYNVVGLGFALSGRLSPVVSAILMPLSSISVVLFVTLATEWKARKRGL